MYRSGNEMIDNAQDWASKTGKYLSGNCTQAETDVLMRWVDENNDNRRFFEEMKSVWHLTKPADQDINLDLNAHWNTIADSIIPSRKSRSILRVMYRSVASVAAIALLVFFVISQGKDSADGNQQAVLVSATQSDEHELVILPDNSKIWLRSGSEVSYDSDFSPRQVVLKGEAFFEVISDPARPFTVKTDEAYVKVLGTRFNLKEMPSGDVELFVEEGRVAFGRDELASSKVIITRDHVAVFRINTLQVEEIDSKDVNRLSWKTKKLLFDNVNVDVVLRDLERHYEIIFEVGNPEMLECVLKANFEDSSVDEVIETIEFTLGWDIENEDGVFRIAGNPCNNTNR